MIKTLEQTQNDLINKFAKKLNLTDENREILTEYMKLILDIEKLKNGVNKKANA